MKYIEEPDITLEMLINVGLIDVGTILYASSDNAVTAILNVDGSITLTLNGLTKKYPYPSGAARAIRGVSISGWVFWRVKENNQFIELLKIKKRYLDL
ncbi:restriction system modified-DNA reader domain-containing protein [Pedobacter duraquae]|uniref:RAMA domain-containing protein n=1 Tax=Pedobacter duraquae TaxID=425511 RepID=A0A4V3C2V2_9SPHI|nr:hypothetical protein [Pedobacter duraquae]TDO19359.1 hypothetical protein CLV32_4599 [Pedobacter duraquae]